MLSTIKNAFKGNQAHTIKSLDAYYDEHTTTKTVMVDGRETAEKEVYLATKSQILETAFKALENNDLESLKKALSRPLKNVPEAEAHLVLATAKLTDTAYFDTVLDAIEKPDDKYGDMFILIAQQGTARNLKHLIEQHRAREKRRQIETLKELQRIERLANPDLPEMPIVVNVKAMIPSTALTTTLGDLVQFKRKEILELVFKGYEFRLGSFEKQILIDQTKENQKLVLESIATNNELSQQEKDTRKAFILNADKFNIQLILSTVSAFETRPVSNQPSALELRKLHQSMPDSLRQKLF